MRDNQAVILTRDGEHVASASCNFTVRTSRTGMSSWAGTLTELEPGLTLQPAEYRLRLSNGEEGDIIVTNVRIVIGKRHAGDNATFQGTGPPPERSGRN